MRLSDDNIRGRTIIAADGQMVGELTALFLEIDTWRVASLQAKPGEDIADQIGANRSIFHAGTLEIPVRMVQSVGRSAREIRKGFLVFCRKRIAQ